jgi:hypothetical protein
LGWDYSQRELSVIAIQQLALSLERQAPQYEGLTRLAEWCPSSSLEKRAR